jgi:hypothetical protein
MHTRFEYEVDLPLLYLEESCRRAALHSRDKPHLLIFHAGVLILLWTLPGWRNDWLVAWQWFSLE